MFLPLLSARAALRATFGPEARQLRRVARVPGSCTVDDIALLLRAHGVPEPRIGAALERLSVIDVSPPVAWAFAMEYDGTELADVLMVSTPDRDMHRHFGGSDLGLTGS